MIPAVRPLEAVVFDVGNVLIRWDPRLLFDKLLPDAAAVDHFLTEVCPPAWNIAQDRGRPWAEGVAEAVARHPEHAALIRAFDRRWMEMAPSAIPENVALLGALKAAGVGVFGLTNFSAEKWAESLQRFDFLGLFDDVVVSAHEGLVKPEPAIYRRAIARTGRDAAALLFVDDSPANIAGAEAVGLPALRYGPEVDLRAALRARGAPV